MAQILAGSLVLVLSASSLQAASWEWSGEVGAELDSVGEEFGGGTLLDVRTDADDPLDDLTDSVRFRDETTRPSGLLRLSLRETDQRLWRGTLRLRSHPERTRGEFAVYGSVPFAGNMVSIQDRVYAEAGGEARGGFINTWDADVRIPSGLVDTRISLGHEYSDGGDDTLSTVFDYQLLRPGLEWSRPFPGGRARFGLGSAHKRFRADEDRNYDETGVGLRLELGRSRRLSTEVRFDHRAYAEADSLTPSFQEVEWTGRWTAPVGSRARSTLSAGLQILQYAIDSSLFRDHQEWDGEWRLEFDLGASELPVADPRSRAVPESVDAPSTSEDALARLDWALAELEEWEVHETVQGGGDPADGPTNPGAAVDSADTLDPAGTPDSVDTLDPAGTLDSNRAWSSPAAAGISALPMSLREDIQTVAARARWRPSIGFRGRSVLGESDNRGDYSEWAGLLGLSRQGERLWLDLTSAVGRRDYRSNLGSTGVSYEGLDFALSGTDYTLFEFSLLSELRLPAAFSIDAFVQFEQELHEEEADDFRLWIVNVSVVRAF